VHRPKDLLDAVEHDAVAWFFARVICREAAVVRWMPILCCENQLEFWLQLIGERDDFITVGDRQRAARQKIILKIDND
jgi:hypothetical protein